MANKFNIPTNYVEKDVPRSTRDLSSNRLSSILSCLHIPMFFAEQIPHDVFKSRVSTVLMSNPFQTPYFGRFKFRVSAFQCPLTNYYGWMDNNTRQKTSAIKTKRHWTVSPLRLTDTPLASSNTVLKAMFNLWPAFYHYASVVPGYVNAPDVNDLSPDVNRLDIPSIDGVDYRAYMTEFINAFSVRAGSLLQYIGLPNKYIYSRYDSDDPVSVGTSGFSYNADRIISYLDVVRSYMVNNQLDSIPYFIPGYDRDILDGPSGGDYLTTTTSWQIEMPLNSMDKFFIWLRTVDDAGDLLNELIVSALEDIGYQLSWNSILEDAFLSSWQFDIIRWLCLLRFGGHFNVRYENDIMQNLLTNIDSLESYVNVVNDKVSMNDLRQSTRDALENDRLAISGGRYKDVLRVLWGSRSRVSLDRPNFIHTYSFYVDPQGVVSQSDTEKTENGQTSGSALGQLNAYVNSSDNGAKRKRLRCSANDQCVFMYIVSLAPEVSYSQGVDPFIMHNFFADDYKPQFDRLGFQDVPNVRYKAIPNVVSNGTINTGAAVVGAFNLSDNTNIVSVGKEVAWSPYMTNVDRSFGLFSEGENLETFAPNRNYVNVLASDVVNAPNGYASPAQWNFMFQVTKASYPNWHLLLRVDLTAHRPIGNRYMPTIE